MNNKVLIVSDSHGLTDELIMIRERHNWIYTIHCGDSELPWNAPELSDVFIVKGNCDIDDDFKLEQELKIGGIKFFVTHGHLYGVKSDLMRLSYRAKECNAQVVCFGHSHIAGAVQEDNQLFINPGSIRQPRGRTEKTYALMEWNTYQEIHVSFYTLGGKKIEAKTYVTTL
ncbi:metallophosphoesterase family protein [Virgibacillus sp. W0430]|uniref:metallophosphoesterase family protein n=1 Tax=Virgibacillus sp. W0430 TaxID=3391580 RepID=UPI003F48D44D